MTVANVLWEAQVDRVSADTQSTSTCSVPTLSLLRALLGLDDTAQDVWNGATAPKSITEKTAPATRAVKRTNKSKVGNNANFTILSCPNPPIKCLPVNRRVALATVTFNKTLKNLGDALKARQTSTYVQSGNTRSPLKETQGRIPSVTKKTSKPGAPSQRVRSKSPELQRKAPQPTPPSFDQSTLLATAECARTCLQCLRLSKGGDSATDKQGEQLEKGALVLISKLQGLGLVASAIEETLNVRKALEHILRRQEEHPMNGAEVGRKSYGSLNQCIDFEYCGNNARTFALITAFQAKVLQLIAVDDGSQAGENLLEQLEPSNARSPCRVLLHGVERGWLSAEKAALQLHALSQNVLSICSVPTNGTSERPTSLSFREVQFRMQCLALQIRCYWWQIAHHQPDIDKEVWVPFNHYVGSLRRSAGHITKAHFLLVKRCLDQLLNVLSETQNALNNRRLTLQPSSAVMLTLQNMAEAAGSTRESTVLLHDLIGLCTDRSGLPAVISYCKLADALLLDIGSRTEDLIHTLETTLTLLGRPLKGTTTEMEDLLIQASSLRKAAVRRFTEISEKLEKSAPHDESYSRLSNVCIRIIFGVLHLVARYTSFKRQDEHKARCVVKSSERGQHLALIAQQSSKSALAAVHSNITHQNVSWELCTAALDDCLAVRKILNEDCEVVPNTDVKVSNVFWLWYLKQKESGASSFNLVSILMRSIQPLERSTPAEARTGFLAVKCERAAALYVELKQINSARQVLAIAITAHLQDDIFSNAFEREPTQSLQQMCVEADSVEFILGRVLSAYARLLLRDAHDPPFSCFYDKAELKREDRALLLEKQFGALRDMLVPQNLHARLKEVVEVVLSLYSESTHLLYQLRFISTVLSFCSRNGIRPCQYLPEQAVKLCKDRPTEYILPGQSASARCLHSFVLVQYAFQNGSTSVELLQHLVSFHTMATRDSCDSWTCVLRSVNDPAPIIAQVQSVVDYTDMLGLMQIKLDALLLMKHLLELQPEKDVPALVSCTTHIGLQYTRMGLTNIAGRALANAERSLTQSSSKTLIALQWHLAYAEYLVALSSCEKATEHLVSAQWRYEADFISDHENGFRGPRIAQHKYLSQAASLASDVALQGGDIDSAIMHAKKSVRLSIRLWSMLEKLLGVKRLSMVVERNDAKLEGLTEDLSDMTLSTEVQLKASSPKAAAFWAYVQIHFDGLLHLSSLSVHHGSFQDAVYYCEQAKKVAEAIESDFLLRRSSSSLAALLAQGGRLQGSQLMLDLCASHIKDTGTPMDSVQVSMALASAHLARGEFNRGLEATEHAQKALSKIQTDDHLFSNSKTQEESSVMAATTQRSFRFAGQGASKASKPHQKPSEIVGSAAHIDVKDVPARELVAPISGSVWMQALQAEALLLKASLCIKSGCEKDATNLLKQVICLARPSATDVKHSVLQATLMLADALRLFQSDAVYSVLSESSIAFPTHRGEAEVDLRYENGAQGEMTSTCLNPVGSPRKKTMKKQASTQTALLKPKELLSSARELLLSFLYSSLSSSVSTVANELCCLLTRVQLISTTVSDATSLSTFQIACHFNAPKSMRWFREVASISADNVLGDKHSVFAWPEIRDCDERTASALDCAVLQQQLHKTLPPSWNVITMAMADDSSEMLISKIRPNYSPFLLRLPLDRSAGDLDEEPFRFHTAYSELGDIISNANLTAHDMKAGSNRQAKKLWWATREALDARLASLLENIETLWFGGFRGVFSDQRHDEELLSRFLESLSRTLDRQLPSRRKTGGTSKPRIHLHPYVLELFVALGHPDKGDLDDAIMDLLYFVIDILQFQDERNAYDEVDFDAIVLEVNDALRSYHEAARDAPAKQGRHTILILDKGLDNFPWESLPCLEGQSVSRMPSLACLQERLLRMRQKDEISSGLHIDACNGAYILNPSSDLASTQETLLGPFSHSLTTYTSIVNRAPSEIEFESCLRDKDLCLYFGHGSGAQYIRGRTIKRLKQCAVTFLMGCSSSKMVECGQFEPYGVPYNYLSGGSAAVVGTLWDVTDKDIDRFAMETFINWGLLERSVVVEKTKESARKRKPKATGRAKRQNAGPRDRPAGEQTQTEVGLDDAVAQARDACVLRYLNGAAPVIYGIPVYLKR
ncbi:hypothetical protein GJ744_004029 [Endocarpon pusillum]|uniref:separase n=1 Tax=Endocarpon pusillum TaxID=364733 RepID=A0A8H7A9W4_9EURO|nr:hypothetical protein GJ744_004029 [Endocarpon pusillum]